MTNSAALFHRSLALVVILTSCATTSISMPAEAQSEAPPLKAVREEFQHQLPSMWALKNLSISDAFFVQGANPPIWKAKVMATIVTKDATYLPTEYTLGTVTVVRLVYKAGTERKLFARVAARKSATKGWEVAFQYDNSVTLSAGLPLNYYFGKVVVEGSKAFKDIDKTELTFQIDAAIKEHEAALADLQKTHDAEVARLKQELNALNDVPAMEDAISRRLEKLEHVITGLHHQLEEEVTQLHSQGISIKQWVSTIVDPNANLPKDSASNWKRKIWQQTRPDLLLGTPDNRQNCSSYYALNKAWSPARLGFKKGPSVVEVKFAEAVIPTQLTVYEVGNDGFVRSLTFHGENPVKEKTVNVRDVTSECPGKAVFQIVGVDFPTRDVAIEINRDYINAKNKRLWKDGIDAVSLTGVVEPKKPSHTGKSKS